MLSCSIRNENFETKYPNMKLKLYVHERKYKDFDLLINPKDFPDIKQGDVLEIYNPDVTYSRLLLQVTTLAEEFQGKDVISVESSIAAAFQLKQFKDVFVNKVDPRGVCLDLVELLYKEQYYSRSDMWRMRKKLVNTCAYLNKKIEFAEMRCQVNELWSKGEKVTCGVINDETRIVYRSSTAVVQIFIQMSSEMWDFDVHGDLYFEKAVNGFLTDLFAKWKEQNCCHDVTIVLFSRTFYHASGIDEFAPAIRDWIQQDYKGRFYEDFYRVVVQNERYEDWSSTLIQLRIIFNEYPDKVVSYHKHCGLPMPPAENSTASQGNFLETLNMSLNLFERYYLDRSFDRTGQVAVVITPGPGVFEVDRELTNITKHRTIDCGIGSDLVCMGEQPLHAAPLFKFHSKTEKITLEVGDDYNIPHWMNHSFYTSKSHLLGSETFIPRIKPPKILEDLKPKTKEDLYSSSYDSDDDFTLIDYDEYDAQVFKLPSRGIPRVGKASSFYSSLKRRPATVAEAKKSRKPRTRYISDDFSGLLAENAPRNATSASSAISIPARGMSGADTGSPIISYPFVDRSNSHDVVGSADSDDSILYRPIVGSAGSPVGHSRNYHHKPRKALINPFAPSRMRFKMTSNRRRWVHAFPTDPSGAAVQTHHTSQHLQGFVDECESGESVRPESVTSMEKIKYLPRQHCHYTETINSPSSADAMRMGSSLSAYPDDPVLMGRSGSPSHSQNFTWSMTGSYPSHSSDQFKFISRSVREPYRTYMWGPTGEQEWSPEMTTGWDWRPLDRQETANAQSHLIKQILTADYNTEHFCAGISVDWKSLTIPASLPITTDFFPDMRSLEDDFVVSQYTILPEIVNSEYWMNQPCSADEKCYRKSPIDTEQLFMELISQRLSQGFQLIILPKSFAESLFIAGCRGAGFYRYLQNKNEDGEVCYLSIGRVYHRLTRIDNTVKVTRYMPRHPHRLMYYKYRYRFQAPDSSHYNLSETDFSNEKLENYNWNYLDHYICTRGEGEYNLQKNMKYWRSRFFLLPCNNATKKISEAQSLASKCDIYEEANRNLFSFIRFAEFLNKIKRTQQNRRNTKASSQHVQNAAISAANTAAAVQSTAGSAAAASSTSVPGGEGSAVNNQSVTAITENLAGQEERLSADSHPQKIIQAMLDPKNGFPFLTKHEGLQMNCFISAEAVNWCHQWLPGIENLAQGLALMQSLLEKQYICHSSGNQDHEFVFGFLLYFIVNKEAASGCENSIGNLPIYHNSLFQNEWLEVAIACEEEGLCTPSYPGYTLPANTLNTLSVSQHSSMSCYTVIERTGEQKNHIYKCCSVDVDPNKKSDRVEWAQASYGACFNPMCTFELEIRWMVASGPVLGELIYSWARKTQTWGFHLLPVPLDPFALPVWSQSDPLRGPFCIHIDLSSVENLATTGCLQGMDFAATSRKILQFQSAIVKIFGFITIQVQYDDPLTPWFDLDIEQYVHSSGGMFVLISDTENLKKLGSRHRVNRNQTAENYVNYLAHLVNCSEKQSQHRTRFPFLWSWNYMLSKRWRSAFTGDEHFQDKLLLDFRKFCSNSEGRLIKFWEKFRSASSTVSSTDVT